MDPLPYQNPTSVANGLAIRNGHHSNDVALKAAIDAAEAAIDLNTQKTSYPAGDAAKVANVPADANAELALRAPISGAAFINVHGSDADAPRVGSYAINIWIGSVEPNNAANSDIYFPSA